jgi:carboxyl-terminal processing protease
VSALIVEFLFVRNIKYTAAAFMLLAFLTGYSFAQNDTVAKRVVVTDTLSQPKAPAVTAEKIEGDLAEALTVIEDNHILGKKIDYNTIFKSAIDGMLNRLDPHSNYFDAKEFEQFRTDQSSRYYGIGATIGDLSDPNGKVVATYIRATFENAPAHRGGLLYGDKIVEINGKSMLGKDFNEVRDLLRGPKGTTAKILVERNQTGKREMIEIIRDAVSQPSIQEAYMIRPGVGYIGMSGGFNQTTYAEFAEAMDKLKSQGMTQLIIDLKGNGGGLVRESFRVANTFLSAGQTVFTQKGRLDGTGVTYRADNKTPETMPLVVLINGSSASASEILTGALQDHDRALIVGENSFGKGLVQNPFPLDYGSMLLLTIAKYETPSGRLIQRDYSDGSLYGYYTHGGIKSGDDDDAATAPKGPESKTDSGRTMYGGGGITPDVEVKADTIPIARARSQQKMNSSIFGFALDLVAGRVKGFENYKVDRPINFTHDITKTDFPVTDELFNAYRKYATQKYHYKPAQINNEREFVTRSLRTELVTAAYGSTTSLQVINEYDNQIMKAVEVLPQAKELAQRGFDANKKATAANTGQ